MDRWQLGVDRKTYVDHRRDLEIWGLVHIFLKVSRQEELWDMVGWLALRFF